MGKKRRMTVRELMKILNSPEVFPSFMGCLIIGLLFIMLLITLMLGVQL